MNPRPPRTSLEQWAILQAVVDYGGFAQAAEALNKSQSSISYALSRLQEQLPIALLRQSGRRSELTEAGKLLLQRARGLLEQAHSLEQLAASLAQGWEPEVRLAVGVVFPPELLLQTLERFANECRPSRVQLIESVLSGTNEALLAREVDLAITGQVPPGFLGTPLLRLDFIAVAHAEHPLHRLGRPLSHHDLIAHRQLVVRDTGLRRKRDVGWLGAEQRWTVSHLKTSILAIKQGLGFAWLPRQHIEEELAAGILKPLPLIEGGVRHEQLYLVFADRDSAGPATRELARLLAAACGSEAFNGAGNDRGYTRGP